MKLELLPSNFFKFSKCIDCDFRTLMKWNILKQANVLEYVGIKSFNIILIYKYRVGLLICVKKSRNCVHMTVIIVMILILAPSSLAHWGTRPPLTPQLVSLSLDMSLSLTRWVSRSVIAPRTWHTKHDLATFSSNLLTHIILPTDPEQSSCILRYTIYRDILRLVLWVVLNNNNIIVISLPVLARVPT